MKMKMLFLAALFLSLPGCYTCERDYIPEHDFILTDNPSNIEPLNSSYDDFNSDMPFSGGMQRFYFSSNEPSHGADFDIRFRTMDVLKSDKSGIIYIKINDFVYDDLAHGITDLVNTDSNQLGPYSLEPYTFFPPWQYFLYAGDDSGNLDIKLVYYHNSDWGTAGGQKRLYGPLDADALNTPHDDAYPSISKDRTVIYFCSDSGGKGFDIYSAGVNPRLPLHDQLTGSTLHISREEVLSGEKDDKCPFTLNDLLVFASDREGGYGGYDLYYSVRSGNTWSTPVNLGEKINTQYNEYRPYLPNLYFDDCNVMVFSSDRPGGKGGYDLYMVSIPKGGE